jgi:hypothetical protein
MFHDIRVAASLFFVLVGTSLSVRAQAPLDVVGVGMLFGDRSNYVSSVSFRVPTTSGYTYMVLLDGKRIPTDVTNQVNQARYHEVFVSRTNLSTLAVSNRLVRFIVRASDRGDTEDGLPPWVPYPTVRSSPAEMAGARLEITAPESFPVGMEIPIVAWIKNSSGGAVRANGLLTAQGHPSIQLRRGVGSGFLGTTNPVGLLNYAPGLSGLQTNKTINVEPAPAWTFVSGTLNGDTVWAGDSRIAVNGNINIPAGSTLTIGDGSIVRLDSLMNITNSGRIIIQGKSTRPVVFTPVTRAQPWGGFFLVGDSAQIDADNAIFIAAGGRQSGFPGHRSEQPLFNILNRARVALTNCAAIYLAGQFHHSLDQSAPYASVTMVNSLIQRCTTAGEFNSCSLTFLQSALIEVPYEDPLYCADPDCDHDGFYLNTGTHELRDSLIGWLKDDCVDSGSGGGPAITTVSNCWLEAAFHEGLAWSGGGRDTRTFNTVLINNGQGFECGWSGGANTPICLGTGLLSLANAVGARYGDNYQGTSGLGLKDGFLTVSNSILLHNDRDVFGQVWDNTWNWRTNDMDIRNNFLTAANPYHPSNSLWNPAADGWRLARHMTTPPNAPVGIGFATWGTQFAMSAIFNGVPVGLSSFTTNPVTVFYSFVTTNGDLLAGNSLTFAPGETIKRIYPSGFNLTGLAAVQLVLSPGQGGELTGVTNVLFQGSVPAPQIFCSVSGNQVDLARIGEGIAVALTTPCAHPVNVSFLFESADTTLMSDTLTFAPGETLKWAIPLDFNWQNYDMVRMQLYNPQGGTLTGVTNIYFVKTAPAPFLPATSLVARGSRWKYRDLASDPGPTWKNTNYNDSSWSGPSPAQLGFSGGEEGDEATLIADNDQITSYFRQTFMVDNPAAFTNLSMWLLRDDAGVVHLNGREVFRSPNLPALPAVISYTNLALGATVENAIDTATLSATNLLAGTNWAAVEIHQQAATSSDVSFDFELFGNPVPPPPPPQTLYFTIFDPGQLTFAWGDNTFILQQANAVTGPWATLANRSPFIAPISLMETQKFFRLRKP